MKIETKISKLEGKANFYRQERDKLYQVINELHKQLELEKRKNNDYFDAYGDLKRELQQKEKGSKIDLPEVNHRFIGVFPINRNS